MNTNQHVQESQRFLERAGIFTTASDSPARAEMFWCAAAHITKALAVQRGWQNSNHRELFGCADKIDAEIGYPDARAHFGQASELHKHMYQGHMTRRSLSVAETKIRHFVNRIAAAVNAYASDTAS